MSDRLRYVLSVYLGWLGCAVLFFIVIRKAFSDQGIGMFFMAVLLALAYVVISPLIQLVLERTNFGMQRRLTAKILAFLAPLGAALILALLGGFDIC